MCVVDLSYTPLSLSNSIWKLNLINFKNDEI